MKKLLGSVLLLCIMSCNANSFKTVKFMDCEWKVPIGFFELNHRIDNLNRVSSGNFESIRFIDKKFEHPNFISLNNDIEKIDIIDESKYLRYDVLSYKYTLHSSKQVSHIEVVIYGEDQHIKIINVAMDEANNILESCK